jgi:hypothetical protein
MADQAIPTKGTNEYLDYVIQLAQGPTLELGVINEPRLYFDRVTLSSDSSVETQGTPDAIYNRELFPVRLTHMTAAVGWDFNVGLLPTAIQSVALQLRYHDQFYMNAQPVPVPAWANKVVAAPDVNSAAMSAWDFVASGSRPPILAKQDTFQVDVQCDDPANTYVSAQTPLDVTVTFTGIGALSRRPYLFSGTKSLTNVQTRQAISASNFRNDGNEPIIITDMTVLVGAQMYQSVFQPGDVRRVSLNVRQVGSGTGSWWCSGPTTNTLCPAALFGLTTGRAVVHQFPGVGQLFGPADGITYMVQRTAVPSFVFAIPFNIGFVGYIMVT